MHLSFNYPTTQPSTHSLIHIVTGVQQTCVLLIWLQQAIIVTDNSVALKHEQ